MSSGSIFGGPPLTEISELNRTGSVFTLPQPLYSFSSPYLHPSRTGSFYGDFPGRQDPSSPGPQVPLAGQIFPRGY